MPPLLQDTRPRSYCIQTRETDFVFIRRLLTEEGLSYRFAEQEAAPAKHQLIVFADSTQLSATPEDATSLSALGGAGIRYHGGRSSEERDSIQAWSANGN